MALPGMARPMTVSPKLLSRSPEPNGTAHAFLPHLDGDGKEKKSRSQAAGFTRRPAGNAVARVGCLRNPSEAKITRRHQRPRVRPRLGSDAKAARSRLGAKRLLSMLLAAMASHRSAVHW